MAHRPAHDLPAVSALLSTIRRESLDHLVVFEPSAVASRAEYLTSAFYLTMVSGSLACSPRISRQLNPALSSPLLQVLKKRRFVPLPLRGSNSFSDLNLSRLTDKARDESLKRFFRELLDLDSENLETYLIVKTRPLAR